MKIEKSGIKIILSMQDIETLEQVKEMLDTINAEVENSIDRDIPCQILTEDNVELDSEDIWNAYVALDDVLSRLSY